LNDKVIMKLDELGGAAGVFELYPDFHIVEKGNYTLKFDIQNNIRSGVGNFKGFKILFNGDTIAHFYKIDVNYISNNISFTISPDGNWINIICDLDLTAVDPNIGFVIQMLSTDSTTVYDSFVSAALNDIAVRNFHLFKTGTEDTTYLETKNVPKVSGSRRPSILFGDHQDGYVFEGSKLNITNKVLLCVCTNDAKIITGPDFELTTTGFISNKAGSPISVSLSTDSTYKRKLVRASHIDGVIQIYGKTQGEVAEIVSDVAANEAPSSGSQVYTLFSECQNFKLYEFIVLDNPTTYEIDAATAILINKYELA